MNEQHMQGPWTFGSEYVAKPTGTGLYMHIARCPSFQEGSDLWMANAQLMASAPDLLAEAEREYTSLADIHNEWPGRNKPEGQMKLARLRDLICKATGREPQDVQDDYGNRAAIARALPQGAPK